jgi:prepilin-type N-terminal cleavage/methylation domain-containing protein
MKRSRLGTHASQGLTLVELLVTVAIVAIALGIGIPSLRDWMIAQRVSGVATELATDLRYARSEALSGNTGAGIVFNNAGNGCYTVYRTVSNRGGCDCTRPAGAVCDAPRWTEVKTMILPVDGEVSIFLSGAVIREAYVAGSKLQDEGGGLEVEVRGGGTRQLKIQTTNGLHHPTVCKPAGSTISGFKPCI